MLNSKNTLAFFIGLFSATQIRIVGLISVSELFILASIPFIVLSNNWNYKNGRFKIILVYAFLWLFGTIISDIYNSTPFLNLAKGLFVVIIFICCLIYSYWLFKDEWEKRLLYWLTGAALSSVLQLYIFPSNALSVILEKGGTLDEYIDAWRMAIVGPFVLLAVYWFYEKSWLLSIVIILISAFYGIYHNSRGTLLIGFVTIGILIILGRIHIDNFQEKLILLKKKVYLVLLIISISCFAALKFYEYGSEKGMFGKAAQFKYYQQRFGNKLGILSGRDQTFIAINAIKDSPIFGFGSYAVDKDKYQEKFYKKTGNKFALQSLTSRNPQRMPSHSYILQAWIENGIFGMVFWLNILFLIFTFIKKALLHCFSQIGYLSMMILNMLWAIFFSPFGERLGASVSIVIMLIILSKLKDERNYYLDTSCNQSISKEIY